MNRLKELRKEKGLTQKGLADEIGTTKLTISNWENGKHAIKSDKAQALAGYFGVTVGYLLGYTNDRVSNNLEYVSSLYQNVQKNKYKSIGYNSEWEYCYCGERIYIFRRQDITKGVIHISDGNTPEEAFIKMLYKR